MNKRCDNMASGASRQPPCTSMYTHTQYLQSHTHNSLSHTCTTHSAYNLTLSVSLIHIQFLCLSVSHIHIHTNTHTHTHTHNFNIKLKNKTEHSWPCGTQRQTSTCKMLVIENDKHKHTEKYPHILTVAMSGGHYRQPYSITIFFQWTMQTLCNFVGKCAVGCLFMSFRSIHTSQTEVESSLPNRLFIPVLSLLSLSLSSFTHSCPSIYAS